MAVAAVRSGKWSVTVVEKGSEICENVRSWSHVKLFSPWSLNMSPAGISCLEEAGKPVPTCVPVAEATPADFPSGGDLLEQVHGWF